jgi:hypothetical protein
MVARANERVEIALPNKTVTINWNERQGLVARLQVTAGCEATVAAFEGVGTSRPVELAGGALDNVETIIGQWRTQEDLPPGIEAVRKALIEYRAAEDVGPPRMDA